MADPVLYIAEPDDDDTVAIDLNAWGGPGGIGFRLAGEPDFGTIEADPTWISQPGVPGAFQAVSHHPVIMASLPLFLRFTNVDDGMDQVRELDAHLNRHGTLVWQPDGAQIRYIDYYPSSLPGLLRGQERSLFKVLSMLMDPDGLPVAIWRHPYARRPLIEGTPVVLSNGITARDMTVNNPGNVEALTRVTITPGQADATLVRARLARRSRGNLTEFAGGIYGFDINSATMGVDTASTTDSEATGGSAPRTTYSSQAGWARRWRHVLSPTSPDTLRGRFRVLLVLRAEAESVHEVQLRWTTDDQDPAEVAAGAVQFNADDVTTHTYVEVDLGIIEMDGPALSLEGWSRRMDGTGGLRWDTVLLFPADEQVTEYSVPGFRGGGSNTTAHTGAQLVNTGGSPVEVGDTKRLREIGDIVSDVATARALPSGRHSAKVRVRLRNKNKSKALLGYLRVRNAGGTIVSEVPLRCRKRRLWTSGVKEITWEAVGGTNYRIAMEMTNKPANSNGMIVVQRLTHSFVRVADSSLNLHVDGVANQAWLREGTARVASLHLQGGPLLLAPGDNVILASLGDLAPSGHSDAVISEPLAKQVPGRSASVKIDVIPRDAPL